MKKLALVIVATFTALVFTSSFAPYTAHAESSGEIMFILDASSSMLAKDGTSTTRIDKAKSALRQTINGLPSDTKVGLRVYGSQQSDSDSNKQAGCLDSRLVTAPAANNAASISSAINSIQAKGWTLMGRSLQDVQKDFKGSGPKTVILLSDGIDTCAPPDACEVAKTLSSNGVDIKVNTLGLLVNNQARSQLSCIAQNSGGNYYDINSLDRLQLTLNSLTAREVSLFTAQGTPIKGSLRIEQAPLMLSDTFYTDSITIPQELYYGFEALPKQKITVTVKAVGRDTSLSNFDALIVGGYYQDTAETLRPFASTSMFSTDVTSAVYKVDTAKEKITKPTLFAFKVAVNPNNTSNVDGAAVPLEIKVTTEGGEAPNNKQVATTASSDDSNNQGMSALTIVLLTLLAVAALAAIAYGAKRYLAKRVTKTPTATGDPAASPATHTPDNHNQQN
jgi:hypothetical protein